MKENIPSLVHMDDHLLVVNKPCGINTHAARKHGNSGLFEWLRDRLPDLSNLTMVHRLDKGTSGLLIFTRSKEANHALLDQFENRKIEKRYLFVTDREVPAGETEINSYILRRGNEYKSEAQGESKHKSQTFFRALGSDPRGTLVEARPVTGRTHQIRIHASDAGFPVLGDPLYGGTEANRLHLHAASIAFTHPETGDRFEVEAEPNWNEHPGLALRHAVVSEGDDFYRVIHGSTDGWPGLSVDRMGDVLLTQSEDTLHPDEYAMIEDLMAQLGSTHLYHKNLDRQVGRQQPDELKPTLVIGEEAPSKTTIRENGLTYNLDFSAGYSVGLFGDQRDNRRRFVTGHIAADFPLALAAGDEVLNTFAYTCGFSVCAALSGARVTSIDLARKQLEWGKENFRLNQIDPEKHDFIYGDVFDWMKRFQKKERLFQAIILDPPTFSRSKASGVFRATRDYPRLVSGALQLLAPEGVLLACTNAASFSPEPFIQDVKATVERNDREVIRSFFAPQGHDFPISQETPLHLKSLWLQIR